jgi:hypothetical protein
VPNHAGLFWISLTIPRSFPPRRGVQLSLTGDTPEGTVASTNRVSIAIEKRAR